MTNGQNGIKYTQYYKRKLLFLLTHSAKKQYTIYEFVKINIIKKRVSTHIHTIVRARFGWLHGYTYFRNDDHQSFAIIVFEIY